MADQRGEPPGREWYADGLRFSCTQCGNCCTGPAGTVWFTKAEGARIAETLGLDEPTFYRRYARKVDGRWSLKERPTPHGHDCIMLDRDSTPGKAVCSIYRSRPTQCRTWPFWPENLASRRAWNTSKRRTPCPGMDTGDLVSVTKIRILRDSTPQ